MSIKISLKDKICLVTGGSRGIGAQCARTLAETGASVIVNYANSSEAAEKVVNDIKNSGGIAKAMQFDVSISEEVNNAVKEIISEFGSIDILVNNAGIAVDSLMMRTSDELWTKTIETNLSSVFYCSRAVCKTMIKKRWGRIINISSIIGEMGNAGQASYASSKAGIFGLTKSLAKEFGSRGVTVNSVAPGFIKTDMTQEMSDENKEKLISSIALGKLGTTEDIANVVLFLASDLSSYITGHTVSVNGGMRT